MAASPQEARMLRLATAAAVGVALALVVAKAVAWWLTDSVAMLASLLDSLMDVGASAVNLLAVRYALTPADSNHRFGHGKAEALAGLGQSLLVVVSAGFLLFETAHRFTDPRIPDQLGVGMAVMVFSMATTLGLVLLQSWVVRQTQSTAIQADAMHYRMDLLSNAAVLLVLVLATVGVHWVDPLLALLIAIYTLFAVRGILWASLDELLDRELDEQTRKAVVATALEEPLVLGVHDLRTRRSGRTLFFELHLELDPQLPLIDVHAISERVEQRLLGRWPGADVTTHHDPQGVAEYRRDAAINGLAEGGEKQHS